MGVQKEIWEKDIEEQIFADNNFLNFVHNADENVVGGRIVHIPQSGGAGNAEKNRGSLPAKIRRRTDTDVVYVLDEYTTDPVLITNAEKKELSYDKRQSAIGEDKESLAQVVGEDFIYKWAKDLPAAMIINTSGNAKPATSAGATGDRAAMILADLQKAQTKMNNQNVSKKNRYALISSELMAQLFPADDIVMATLMQNVTEEERQQGVIGIRHGFKLLDRSTVMTYAADGTLKAPGALAEAGDCEGVLCWQKEALERAKGTIEFFAEEGKPEYYGDVYSMLVRAGGRRRRADNKGVIVIKQKTV